MRRRSVLHLAFMVAAMLRLPGSLLAATGCADFPGSPAEQKVWSHVCRGEPADLTNDSQRDRQLSKDFLQTILLEKPWRSAITWRGVEIRGAIFKSPLLLDGAEIDQPLRLEACVFAGAVSFTQSHLRRLLSLDGSRLLGIPFPGERKDQTVKGSLFLNGTRVDGNLILNSVRAHRIEISNAKVEGNLFLTGASIGSLAASLIRVGGDVLLQGTTVETAEMPYADVGGSIVIHEPRDSRHRSSGVGTLTLRDASARVIQIVGDQWPDKLDLRGFRYQIVNTGSGREAMRDITSEELDRYKSWLESSKPPSPQPYHHLAQLLADSGALIESRQVLYAAEETERTITGATCKTAAVSVWDSHRLLVVAVAVVMPLAGAVIGFRTRRRIELPRIIGATCLLYLATLLILFVSRSLESCGSYVWQTGLWLLMGYGYDLSRIWIPIGALLLAGMAVLKRSGEAENHKLGSGFWFSFDLLLPLVKLREDHYHVPLKPSVQQYFYFHRIMGYVLATFLAGALQHLAK